MNAPRLSHIGFSPVGLRHGLQALAAAGVDVAAFEARLDGAAMISWREVATTLDALTLSPAQERKVAETLVTEHPVLWLAGVLRLSQRGFVNLLTRALAAAPPLLFKTEVALGARLELTVELREGLAPCARWWRLLEAVVTLAPTAVQHPALELEHRALSERGLRCAWRAPAVEEVPSFEARRMLEALAQVVPFFAGLEESEQGVSEVLLLQRELGLTRAEARVAVCVTNGLTARETAAELGVSYETVRTHLRNINARFELSSQRELATLIERWRTANGRR